MISDRVRQLLTAYVDGELPAQAQEAASRLLEQSPEAQAFVRQLESDAAALRRLPRHRLGEDFSEKVMHTIGRDRLRRRARLFHTSVYPTWIGVASAAAVLFVVGVGAALYFYQVPARQDDLVIAKNDKTPAENPRDNLAKIERKSAGSASGKDEQATSNSLPQPAGEKSDTPALAEKLPVLEFTPDADIATDTIPTQRFEVFNELEQVKLALNLTLRDLDLPRVQEKLRNKLKEDTAFQLDLSCPASAKGLDRLEAAFQARGVKLVIDKAALTRWKKGLKTHYAFYSKDLTSEELTSILQTLGADDQKVDPSLRFNNIIINHLTPANQKQISTLLGVDSRSPPANDVPSKGPLGVDITKPISKKTEDQVADALAGKGPPRPEPGKRSQSKAPERLALVLSYNPVRAAPTTSKEIKQFLADCPGQRTGAVQVLLVLRGR
jgi:hypothetical protein